MKKNYQKEFFQKYLKTARMEGGWKSEFLGDEHNEYPAAVNPILILLKGLNLGCHW